MVQPEREQRVRDDAQHHRRRAGGRRRGLSAGAVGQGWTERCVKEQCIFWAGML